MSFPVSPSPVSVLVRLHALLLMFAIRLKCEFRRPASVCERLSPLWLIMTMPALQGLHLASRDEP